MSQNIVSLQGQVPAHIAAAFGGQQSNSDLAGGVSMGYPIISYKGKAWHVVTGDDRELITMDLNGTEIAAPFIRGVLIRANPNLNKTYYPNGYEEGTSEKPVCHSNDSIAPALDAQQPQAAKCAVCPHNQWGSRITENNARGKACSDSRRIAVAPEGDIENVMLLRVPAASLKNLLAYSQQLDKRGVPYQALVTEIGFDPQAAFPQLTFKPARWLDTEEVAQVQEAYDSDLVATITALNAAGHAAAEPPPAADDGFLPPGGPAGNVAPPAQTAAPKQTSRMQTRQAQPAEVDAALQGVQAQPSATEAATSAAPKKTGFGKAKAQAQPAAEAAPQPAATAVQQPAAVATELAEGVDAEMDAVLGAFDDA